MADRRVLERLLRLRQLEEEFERAELERAVRERDRIESEVKSAQQAEARGRRRFVEAVLQGDSAGRAGRLLEVDQAGRWRKRRVPQLGAANLEVVRQRQEFLERRMAKRQVETLVDQAQAEASVAAARRAQQMLDDWFGRRGQAPRNSS